MPVHYRERVHGQHLTSLVLSFPHVLRTTNGFFAAHTRRKLRIWLPRCICLAPTFVISFIAQIALHECQVTAPLQAQQGLYDDRDPRTSSWSEISQFAATYRVLQGKVRSVQTNISSPAALSADPSPSRSTPLGYTLIEFVVNDRVQRHRELSIHGNISS